MNYSFDEGCEQRITRTMCEMKPGARGTRRGVEPYGHVVRGGYIDR